MTGSTALLYDLDRYVWGSRCTHRVLSPSLTLGEHLVQLGGQLDYDSILRLETCLMIAVRSCRMQENVEVFGPEQLRRKEARKERNPNSRKGSTFQQLAEFYPRYIRRHNTVLLG